MTRHNMGFDVINKIAKKYEIDISRSKFNGLYGSGIINNEKKICNSVWNNISDNIKRDIIGSI